jgi:hypothetical protein
MDLHPADGVYSELPGCTQWHSKGVYQIPYRTMYSRNIRNLFLTGRLISVSHVAFGSTRVMATCAHNGQAVGMAAALCREHGVQPREVPVSRLQQELLKAGQHIPGVPLEGEQDLARQASIRASSRFELGEMPPDGSAEALDTSRAMLLPVTAGVIPAVTFVLDVARRTVLEAEVRESLRPGNYTPERVIHRQRFELAPGEGQTVCVAGSAHVEGPRYLSYVLMHNDDVSVHLSDLRVTGVLSLSQSMNKSVAKGTKQEPPAGSGIDSFEFWLPSRRPGGRNMACSIEPPLCAFAARSVVNGVARPTVGPNAWVAAPDDAAPALTLEWESPQTIGRIELVFDTDFDHPMESVLMGHPERDMPFCVKGYRILDSRGAVVAERSGNHQTRNSLTLPEPVTTTKLLIEILSTHGAPAALFEVRCYAQ